jgi:hypothetical protein
MASVQWCVPIETADDHDIVCVARTAPIRWNAAIPVLHDSPEALLAINQAERTLVQRVSPTPQRRLHCDDLIFVSKSPVGACDHCKEGEWLQSNPAAGMPDGSTPVRLQLILRKRNLTYDLRPEEGVDQGNFSVGWELDAVLYSDEDWPF